MFRGNIGKRYTNVCIHAYIYVYVTIYSIFIYRRGKEGEREGEENLLN